MTDAPKLTEEALPAMVRRTEDLRSSLIPEGNVAAGTVVLVDTQRLVAEIRRLRQAVRPWKVWADSCQTGTIMGRVAHEARGAAGSRTCS